MCKVQVFPSRSKNVECLHMEPLMSLIDKTLPNLFLNTAKETKQQSSLAIGH